MNIKFDFKKYLGIGKKKPAVVQKKKKFGEELGYDSREAFNTIRTNIGFVLPVKNGVGRVFGITSANPQDGKSSTGINLAYTLAKAGHKTLFVDGDMRRPTISKYLKLKGHKGLSNVLSAAVAPEFYTGVLNENMDVLGSGDIPPNPSELLASEEMGKFISDCTKVYDYVIVDLPPVLAVTDAVAVSKYLDGIVIVVRHAVTRKRDLARAVSGLEFSGVRILGFIYNAYRSGFGHYYVKKYKSRYAYGSDTNKSAADAKPSEEKKEA